MGFFWFSFQFQNETFAKGFPHYVDYFDDLPDDLKAQVIAAKTQFRYRQNLHYLLDRCGPRALVTSGSPTRDASHRIRHRSADHSSGGHSTWARNRNSHNFDGSAATSNGPIRYRRNGLARRSSKQCQATRSAWRLPWLRLQQ